MKLEQHPRILVWSVIVLAATTVLFGELWQHEVARRSAYVDAINAIQLLRTLDARFAKVGVMVSSHPRANFYGEVESQKDRDFLDQKLTETLGSERRKTFGFVVRIVSKKD